MATVTLIFSGKIYDEDGFELDEPTDELHIQGDDGSEKRPITIEEVVGLIERLSGFCRRRFREERQRKEEEERLRREAAAPHQEPIDAEFEDK